MSEYSQLIHTPLLNLELRSTQGMRTDEYDGVNAPVEFSVRLHYQGRSISVQSVDELRTAFSDTSISIRDLAKSAPADLARVISHLDDQSRVVREHPMFSDLIEEFGSSALPVFDGSTLTWSVVVVSEESGVTIEERVFVLADKKHCHGRTSF